MAYMNAAAILTRIREVLDDNAGTLRKIAAATYQSGLYTGLDTEAQSLRALSTPIFEIEITGVRRHPDSPPNLHSMALKEVSIRVTVVRAGTLAHKLDEDTRDALHGLAAQDADVISQALTYPGNLTQTEAAAATGLVSGLLIYDGGSTIAVGFEGETGARITSTHEFRGVVNVTQATS